MDANSIRSLVIMAVATPEWLTKDFLEKALRKHLKDVNIKILEYTSTPAIPVGENFTSDILRISIKYAQKRHEHRSTLSVIVKFCPDNTELQNYNQTMKLFEQEAGVYTEVFPAIMELLEDTPENNKITTLGAKCFYTTKEPQWSIILEDLTAQGFKMHQRQEGLNLQHCVLVAEMLAYLHATTAVLYEKNPSLIDKYNLGIFWKNDFSARWIKMGFAALIEACENWPGYEKYASKLKRIHDKVLEKSFAISQRNPDDLNVLNHGDAWTNNFMFLNGPDREPLDFRFVDLQVPLYSSPALDLNYFWATSPNLEVRNQHFGTLLDHYHERFNNTLQKLHYAKCTPSREQLQEEFNSRGFYGLAAAVTVLPLVAATKRDDATFEDLFADDQKKDGFKYDAYNNERYRKYMEYLLKFYDNLGILD